MREQQIHEMREMAIEVETDSDADSRLKFATSVGMEKGTAVRDEFWYQRKLGR